MSKDSYVRSRVDRKLKKDAEIILKAQGFSMSQAIRMMLTQVVIQGKLPFPLEGGMKLNARAHAISDAVDAGTLPLKEHRDSTAFFGALGI